MKRAALGTSMLCSLLPIAAQAAYPLVDLAQVNLHGQIQTWFNGSVAESLTLLSNGWQLNCTSGVSNTCYFGIVSSGTGPAGVRFLNSNSGTAIVEGILSSDSSGDLAWTGSGTVTLPNILDSGVQNAPLYADGAGNLKPLTIVGSCSYASGTLTCASSSSGTATANTALNPPVIAGQWQADDHTPTAKCTLSVTGQIADYPIDIKNTSLSINKLAVDASGGGTASVIDVGIRADASGRPGTLLLDAGQISMGTGAPTTNAFPSLTLPQGRYWVEVETVSAGTTNPVVWGPTDSVGTGPASWQTSAAVRVIGASTGAAPVLSGGAGDYMLISNSTGTAALASTPGSFAASNSGCMPAAAWLIAGGTQ